MATRRTAILLAILLAAAFIHPAQAQIFADDFEIGDGYGGWDATGTGGTGTIAATQAPDPVHHNTNASKVVVDGSSDWGYASQNFGSYATIYIRFYLYMDDVPTTTGKWFGILRVRDTTTGYDMFILMILNSGGTQYWRINYRSAGSTSTTDDGDSPPTADAWRCVEIKIACSSADGELDGSYEVWIDGASIWSISGIDTDATTVNLMHVGIAYGNIWNAANNVYNDCVVVDSSYIGPEGEAGQDLTFINASNLLLHDSATAGRDLARTYGDLLHLYASDSMNKEIGFRSTGTLALWASYTIGKEWGFTLGGLVHLWAHTTIGKELAFTATNVLHLWSSTATSFEIAAAGLNEVFTLLATLRLHAAALPTLEVRTPVEHAFNLYAAIHLHDSLAVAKELGYVATATIRLWDSAAMTTQGVAQELTFILTETLHLIASVAATMQTAALILDAASIAGLALIIALVAVALVMVRRRND